MDRIRYPGTQLEVSAIALGCMNLGGHWDSSRLSANVYRKAERAVLTAVDEGITLFDHADIYCRGKSERVFGKILASHPQLRDRIIIQTKCGIRLEDTPTPGTPARYDSSCRHILNSVRASLRRLQIETIDILLLHRPDPLIEPEEVARAFRQLHEDGHVRQFGVSNYSWAQIRRLQAAVDQRLIVNQLQLSLGHSDLIWNGVVFNHSSDGWGETLDEACRQQIQIQAWGPLDQGKLISPARGAKKLSSKATKMIRQLAKDRGLSPEAIQLGWVLSHPARIQPIVGTTRPERIRACVQADQVKLSREEWFSLLVAARDQELP